MKNQAIKITMFTVYHLILAALVWLILSQLWLPIISHCWWWLENTLKVFTYTGLTAFGVWSILSCFDDEKLNETDLGHWTISGWLPKHPWAANMKNGPMGIFTGLPAWAVSIKKIDGRKISVKKKFAIQVEIDGDPQNRKFAAIFDTSFNFQVMDTLKSITTPSKQSDFEAIFEKALTDWLNHPTHNYKEVRGIKAELDQIQTSVIAAIADAENIYGVKMSDTRVIDVQLPDEVIRQQIDEARQKKDVEGFIEQFETLQPKLSGMKTADVVEQLNLILGLTKKTTVSGGKGGRGGGVTPIVSI